MSEGDAGKHLASISPDKLTFTLTPNSQPGCIMTITNLSDQPVAFKVKTTDPKRYLVRPNQGVVNVSSDEIVNIYVVEKECNTLLDYSGSYDGKVPPCSDKFLTQMVKVDQAVADKLQEMDVKEAGLELQKLWGEYSKDKRDQIRNKKLLVSFDLPLLPKTTEGGRGGGEGGVGTGQGTGSVPTSPAELVGSASRGSVPVAATRTEGALAGAGGGASPSREGGGGGGGPDAKMLRRKYEDLVTYTAELTEERDMLTRDLEEEKKKLQREMAQRMALGSKGLHTRAGGGAGLGRGAGSRGGSSSNDEGYSFLFMAAVALFCLCLGKYFGSSSGAASGEL